MADPYGEDRTFTGPTSAGMGQVSNQEIDMMNTMTKNRQDELQQRAHQTYIQAIDNLRRAEQQGNFPSMSEVADAQNRLNMVNSNAEFPQYLGHRPPFVASSITEPAMPNKAYDEFVQQMELRDKQERQKSSIEQQMSKFENISNPLEHAAQMFRWEERGAPTDQRGSPIFEAAPLPQEYVNNFAAYILNKEATGQDLSGNERIAVNYIKEEGYTPYLGSYELTGDLRDAGMQRDVKNMRSEMPDEVRRNIKNPETFESLIDAVQSGKITPSQAATMATGVPASPPPTGSGSTTDAEMKAYQDAIGLNPLMGSGSTTDAEMKAYQGALGNLPSEVKDTDSFLRNLQQKRSAQ
jgi:hypothetical protein